VGIYDRPYMNEPPGGGFRGFGRAVGAGMPKPAKAVKILLLLNIAAFVLQALSGDLGRGINSPISEAFAVSGRDWMQAWRYITFQFLHGGVWHIGLNMLGLYMLGTPLERQWGTKRFTLFYLTCGAVAGMAYAGMTWAADVDKTHFLVGASGGVYAIVLACGVLFPQIKLILLLFPVPIRFACLLIFGFATLTVLQGVANQAYGNPNFWSQVAHLGGVVAGAFWIWVLPAVGLKVTGARLRAQQGAWDRKMKQQAEEEKSIDEILRKIHEQGINSLTSKEKKTLADATKKTES